MNPRRPLRPFVPACLIALLLLVGCGGSASPPPASPASSSPAPSPTVASTTPAGDRPVIVTTDLDTSDLYALMVLLRMPGVDVRAIGIDSTGEVHCAAGLRIVPWLLEQLGRTGIPYGCGPNVRSGRAIAFPDEWRANADRAAGLPIPMDEAPKGESAEAIFTRVIEASPVPPLLVALGPWTTLADLFKARPDLVMKVAGIHAMAGVIDSPGNVEIGPITTDERIEWNVAADPDGFAAVLALDMPITLVPLDATDDVPLPMDIATRLETDHEAAGADIAYEVELRNPGRTTMPGLQLWDELAVVTLETPDVATWKTARVTVTTDASPAGRIRQDSGGREIRYASEANPERSVAAILAGLRRGAARPLPFKLAGELTVAWDGAVCQTERAFPTSAGESLVRFHNATSSNAGVTFAGIANPHILDDLMVWIQDLDLSVEPVLPDWIVPLRTQVGADAMGDGEAVVSLPIGTVAALCVSGEWPKLAFTPAPPLELASP